MIEKPIILLDVDEVLNISDPKQNKDWWFDKDFISDPDSGRFRLILSQEMADALVGLDCDIQWLTSWCETKDSANPNVGASFGWPYLYTLSRLNLPKNGEGVASDFWKQLCVRKVCKDPGPPVIWIDDDADYFIRHLADYIGRTAASAEPNWLDPHKRLLAITPQVDIGITKAHIEQIENHLASWRAGEKHDCPTD